MATVSITHCDGGAPECHEFVKAEVVLRIIKDSTVLLAARQDSCDYHVGDVALTMWQGKEELIQRYIDESVKDDDSQGWKFHSVAVIEQG